MKKLVSLLLGLFCTFAIWGQSADEITKILESENATYSQVCYLSAVHQGFVDDDATYEESYQALVDNELIINVEDINQNIPLGEVAFIFSKMWNVDGGIMYRITKGNHRYSFKQFQSDGILSLTDEPSDFVSGVKILQIYTSCVSKYSDFNLNSVSMESE